MTTLTEKEELELALALSLADARSEQEACDRKLAEEIQRQLIDENESFWDAVNNGRERVDVGLRPQEAAAFAAYTRQEKYNNYGKKVKK